MNAHLNSKIIIVNLVGGLGNQMFQYACASALAMQLRMPLKVTRDMFGVYTFHNGPELDRVFSLELDVARIAELRRMIGLLRVSPVIRRLLASESLQSLRGRNFIKEPHFCYWGGLLERARRGGYLQGYWQSERYFSRHSAIVRSDFVFRQEPNKKNAELIHTMRKSVAVSLHVRRGDYVSNPKTHAIHGTCSEEYYLSAIAWMSDRIPTPRFFVFSDDPAWVEANLATHVPNMVIVDHNHGSESFNDMRIMSLCRHHIIANSTFSWWGAWLNPDPKKIVVAPRNWFVNSTDTTDLLPATWIQL